MGNLYSCSSLIFLLLAIVASITSGQDPFTADLNGLNTEAKPRFERLIQRAKNDAQSVRIPDAERDAPISNLRTDPDAFLVFGAKGDTPSIAETTTTLAVFMTTGNPDTSTSKKATAQSLDIGTSDLTQSTVKSLTQSTVKSLTQSTVKSLTQSTELEDIPDKSGISSSNPKESSVVKDTVLVTVIGAGAAVAASGAILGGVSAVGVGAAGLGVPLAGGAIGLIATGAVFQSKSTARGTDHRGHRQNIPLSSEMSEGASAQEQQISSAKASATKAEPSVPKTINDDKSNAEIETRNGSPNNRENINQHDENSINPHDKNSIEVNPKPSKSKPAKSRRNDFISFVNKMWERLCSFGLVIQGLILTAFSTLVTVLFRLCYCCCCMACKVRKKKTDDGWKSRLCDRKSYSRDLELN